MSQSLDGRVKCLKSFPNVKQELLDTHKCQSSSTMKARREAGMVCVNRCCLFCEHGNHEAVEPACSKQKHQYCYFANAVLCRIHKS